MQISLRSQLAAGVAFAGAAAIAVTPVVQPAALVSLDRVTAKIQMAAWANPLSVLGQSLGVLGTALFSGDLQGVPIPLGETGASVLSPEGLLPQLLSGSEVVATLDPSTLLGGVTGTPILTQLGLNLSGYLNTGVDVLEGVTDAVGAVTFGVPLIAFDVVTSLIEDGTIPDIGALVQTYIIDPITTAIEGTIDAASALFDTVLTNVTNLFTALPDAVIGVAQTVIGGLLYTGTGLIDTVTGAAESLFSLQIQDAWNTTVNGLLGPNGLVGNLTNLSLGSGVFTSDPETPFIPSLRQALTGVTTGVALTITPAPAPPPTASVSPAAAVAEAPVAVEAPTVAEVEAPAAVEAPAVAEVEAPAAVEAAAAVEAPAAPRAARSAAVSEAPAASAGDDDGAAKSTPKRAARGAKKASSAE